MGQFRKQSQPSNKYVGLYLLICSSLLSGIFWPQQSLATTQSASIAVNNVSLTQTNVSETVQLPESSKFTNDRVVGPVQNIVSQPNSETKVAQTPNQTTEPNNSSQVTTATDTNERVMSKDQDASKTASSETIQAPLYLNRNQTQNGNENTVPTETKTVVPTESSDTSSATGISTQKAQPTINPVTTSLTDSGQTIVGDSRDLQIMTENQRHDISSVNIKRTYDYQSIDDENLLNLSQLRANNKNSDSKETTKTQPVLSKRVPKLYPITAQQTLPHTGSKVNHHLIGTGVGLVIGVLSIFEIVRRQHYNHA
ncbi:hypothetical protein ACNAN0_06440 [Agrilactobacillus fermenti]|uniref:hypothetical protein n=1 Tax=Agrilactobacillus fermenti TaxID=2586909 RepID=UPI001E42C5A7|nr:hypothetical protein [Agrilactobacillus fermenti]MCD2257368.1 hypothetical protein [Agrilactobacillus fermenti]